MVQAFVLIQAGVGMASRVGQPWRDPGGALRRYRNRAFRRGRPRRKLRIDAPGKLVVNKTELVDVFVDQTTIQVWSKNHLINTVARERSGPVRKVRADGLHVKHQPDTERQASARILPGPPTIPQVGGVVNLCSGHLQHARADLGLSPESSWSLEVGGLARWLRSDPFSRA
jgi:hypothetical protein